MMDSLLAVGLAVGLLYLLVIVTSALVSEHTDARMPKALSRLKDRRGGRRRNLIIEVPWTIAIIGGGELVMLLVLLHQNSTLAVRLIAGLELLTSAAWMAYLVRLVSRSAHS